MSNILPRSSQTGISPLSRQGRELTRLVASTELAIAETAAEAAKGMARLDAVDAVAQRGMQGVALVSQMEQQLAQMVPIATSRLQAIGDMHALSTAQEISSFTRRLS
jgi:hypothetical protein